MTADVRVNFVTTGQEILTGALRGIGEGALGFVVNAFQGATDAVGDLASGMVAGNAEFERYEVQFGVLLGDVDAARERLQQLAVVGASTPFELPELVRGDKILQAFGLHAEEVAARFGMSGEQIRLVAGDVAAGTGQSFEDIATYLGKFSSGATGEALARFQELGIVTKQELAAMGLEFDKAGSLMTPVDEAMDVVLAAMQGKFGGMMEAQSSTFEGMMSNFEDWKAGAIRTIGAPLFEVAKEGLGKLLEVLNSPEAQAGIQSLTEGLTGIMKVLSDLLMTILGQTDPTEKFLSLWESLSDTFGPEVADTVTGFVEGLMGTVSGLFDGVSGAISGLVSFVSSNLPLIQETIGTVFETMQPVVQAFTDLWVGTLQPAFASLFGDVSAGAPTMQEVFSGVMAGIVVVSQGLADFLVTILIPGIKSVVDWVVVNWPGIRDTIAAVMATVQAVIVTVLGFIQKFWAEHGESIMTVVRGMLEFVGNLFSTHLANIQTGIQVILSGIQVFWDLWGDDILAIVEGLFGFIGGVWDAFALAFEGDWKGFGAKLREAWDKLWADIGAALQKALDDILALDWNKIGQDMLKGLTDGVIAGTQALVNAVIGAAQAAWDAVTGFNDQHSPSRRYHGAGLMAMAGMAGGVAEGTRQLVRAADRASSTMYRTVYNNLTVNTSAPFNARSNFALLRGRI